MKKLFTILAAAIVFCSCTKEVDLNVPELPSKLAVSALWKENEVLTAVVSRTLNVKDKPKWSEQDKFYVTNAEVSVLQNNILYDQLVYNTQERKYKSATGKTALPGNTYTVKVTAPGFTEAATATASFLSKVPISSMTFRKEVTKDDFGQTMDEIRIEFDDPVQEKNFYLMTIQRDQSESGYNWVYPQDKDIVVPLGEDPFETTPGVPANRIIFSDQLFDGQRKSIVIRVPSYYLRDWQNNNEVKGLVSLFNVSEAVFLYQKSRLLDTENPFAEPVQPYTNISNGFGIFDLLRGDTKSIQ